VALVLTVNSDAWNQQVESLTSTVSGLIPVVKGNGYGFGRDWLAERAARIASTLAVGTVFEVGSVPTAATPMVLTPTLEVPHDLRADAILTVGSLAHITAASGKPRNVVVKIRSSMNRYGASVGDVPELINQCRANNLQVRSQ
jgi:alanine racemase